MATYGELFSITRQAIINDDLMALTDIPRKMGMAATATIGDLVYALLVAEAPRSRRTARRSFTLTAEPADRYHLCTER